MKKQIQVLTVLATSMLSMGAYAGMTTDHEGNVGYDTAAECDAAVHAGTARFYTPVTQKSTLKRTGETAVHQATLRDLGGQYQYGACDLGVGRSFNRDGVTRALQGKYVPFSPDMPVNVYTDATGNAVRASMGQCDNNFSGNLPRPVPAPVRQEAVTEQPAVVEEPAPAAERTIRPYAFGTVGALQDGLKLDINGNQIYKDNDTRVAGQVGAGVQFGNVVGAEVFYQGAAKHKYQDNNTNVDLRNNTYGARLTLGSDIGEKFRVFGKVGAAAIRHSQGNFKDTKTRATAGLGMLYKFTENVALRADYDHYFKRSSDWNNVPNGKIKWKGANYLGTGVQYTF